MHAHRERRTTLELCVALYPTTTFRVTKAPLGVTAPKVFSCDGFCPSMSSNGEEPVVEADAGAAEADAPAVADTSDAPPRTPVSDLVASLNERHLQLTQDLMSTIAQTAQDEATQKLMARLEVSEARNEALEARLAAVERQASSALDAAQKSQSKWPQMAPALVALLGKGGGKSDEEKAALQSIASMGEEVGDLRQTVQAQSIRLNELHDDVHDLADQIFEEEPAAPAAAAAVPPGFVDLSPPRSASGGGAGASVGASTSASATSSPSRRRPKERKEAGGQKLDKMMAQLASFKMSVEGALAEAGMQLGGAKKGGSGTLDERLSVLETNVLNEVRTLAAENAALRARLDERDAEHAAAQAALAEVRAEMQAASAAQGSAAFDAFHEQLAALDGAKASRHEFDALADALRELRTDVLTGHGGGGESDRELLATLQAAQQSTQGHVLSLQTHLRALLRKAEQEKQAGAPTVDMGVIDALRGQVHEALHELQQQITALAEGKADADKVELALESKAERRLMAHKADRAFCEALLARFAVEVGRQLGDMEQSQMSIKGSLEEAVVRLMHSSAEHAATAPPLPPPRSSSPSAHRAMAAAGPTATATTGGADAAVAALSDGAGDAAGGGAPFSVRQMRVRSAGSARPRSGGGAGGLKSSGRGGSAPPLADPDLPPMGMGQLAMSLFVTGETDAPQPDPQRYAFQPRRNAAGVMTPGEHQLVRQRPMTAAGRLASGKLRSSASSAGLLTSGAPRPPGMRA